MWPLAARVTQPSPNRAGRSYGAIGEELASSSGCRLGRRDCAGRVTRWPGKSDADRALAPCATPGDTLLELRP